MSRNTRLVHCRSVKPARSNHLIGVIRENVSEREGARFADCKDGISEELEIL